MCGFFTKTPPPELTKQELDLGLGKSQNEILELRILNGFKILGSNSTTYPSGIKEESVSARKSFKGGYGIQIINIIKYNYDRCDIYFMGFQEEDVRAIMDKYFVKIGGDKWVIHGNQHFWLRKQGYTTFEMMCSNPDGKSYV